MRVLVVERHPVAKSLELLLSAEGHTVYVTDTCADGAELARIYDYDAIFLSLQLDDIPGSLAVRAFRVQGIATPILALGDQQVEVHIQALAAGADDVVTRPIHHGVLLARLAAVVRRSRGYSDSVLRTGPIALNMATRRAEVAGQAVHLTPSEYKILELFSLRKNTALSKEQCLSHLYNGMSEPEPKIIDVFVCKLRKKIAAATGGDPQIETVWGGGYMLRDSPEGRAAA